MRRSLASAAEVFRRGNQSGSEVLLPDPVHDDARGKRIFARDQPAAKRQSIGLPSGQWRQRAWRRGLDGDAGPAIVPSHQDACLRRIRACHHDVALGQLRELLFQGPVCALQLVEVEILVSGRFLEVVTAHDRLDEVPGEQLPLPRRATVRGSLDRFAAAVHLEQEKVPEDLPNRLEFGARAGGRREDSLLPVLLQFGNSVAPEQFVATAFEFGAALQIRLSLARQRRIDVRFDSGVEEGVKAVEVLLGDGIELVVVAAGAADSQSQPHGGNRARAIHRALDAIHLEFESPFAVVQGVAVKSSRDALVDGRAGEQVSGDLLHREAVEAQVAVERVGHPVPPSPRVRTDVVRLVAVAFSESRLVQPVHSLHFPVVRGGKQVLDHAFVAVCSEATDCGGTGRKSRQIESQPSQENVRRGFGRGLEPLAFQAGGHERVDGIADPSPAVDVRHARSHGRDMRPMLAARGGASRGIGFRPRSALIDPRGEQRDLVGGQRVAAQGHGGTLAFRALEHGNEPTAGTVSGSDGRA